MMRLLSPIRLWLLAGLVPVLAQAQPAELLISPGPGPVRLGVRGEFGREYHLEGAADLASSNHWQFLLSLRLTNDNQGWFDSSSLALTQRFYRVVAPEVPAPDIRANDFRLIDHLGISRQLYYPSNNASVRAYAL